MRIDTKSYLCVEFLNDLTRCRRMPRGKHASCQCSFSHSHIHSFIAMGVLDAPSAVS